MTTRTRRARGAVLVLAGLVIGGMEARAATETVTFRTPAGAAPGDITLGANGSIELLPQASVRRENGQPALLSNLGPDGVRLDPMALAGQVRSASAVTLQPQAHLLGGIEAPVVTIDPGAVVDGAVDTTPQLDPAQAWSFAVTFPPSPVVDVIVDADQVRSLVPGPYRSIKVRPGGTLVVGSGDYVIDRLSVHPNALVKVVGTSGPTRLYAAEVPRLSGQWRFEPAYHGLALVQTGADTLRVSSPFRGVILAPLALLDLADYSGVHRGAFFARSIRVGIAVGVVHESANPIVSLLTPPGDDLQRCAEAVRPRDDLDGKAREIAYQADIARYCSMAGGDDCAADLAGRVNVDSFLAAGRLIGEQLTPAEYLALMRNLIAKRKAWEADAARAAALCSGGDADGDMVPDPQDDCPGTADMTPTDAHGCPDPTLPPAPSADDLRRAFQTKGFMFNQACAFAPVMSRIPAGAFYRPAQLEKGDYILSGRVSNQPPGCPVWYFFDIEETRPGQPMRTYMVAFAEFEAYAPLVGIPDRPVPPGFIQFNPLPGDAGTRGLLGSAGGRSVRFRVQAMNGGGISGGWSEWKWTTNDDCTALGFSCP
jgi:hypothetical protein